jgi:nucleoid-associated protein YgaU
MMSVVFALAALLIVSATITLDGPNAAETSPGGTQTDLPGRSPGAQAPSSYVIRPGDTLRSLALRFYGDEGLWQVLLDANRRRLPRPEDLQVGTQIVVPDR